MKAAFVATTSTFTFWYCNKKLTDPSIRENSGCTDVQQLRDYKWRFDGSYAAGQNENNMCIA